MTKRGERTIRHHCKDCLYYGHCARDEAACEYLVPLDGDERCDELVADILKHTVPAGERVPRAAREASRGTTADSREPLYAYYRRMLCDALHDVRTGGTAYLYSRRQLRDFLRYERDVETWLRDGIFYIRKQHC